MARRPSGRAHVGKRRQRVEWTAGDMEAMVTLAPNTLLVLGSSLLMLDAIDSMTAPTLVRLRGELLSIASAGTANNQSLLGVGIAVVNRRASDVGATAIPRPVSDPQYSWLWHSYSILRFSVGSTAQGAAVNRVIIDGRAMRKILSNEEEIVFCFENNTVSDVSILAALSVRVLLKE